jgi:NADPH:quinone reductase-like Zn-dependent oxidoreductase
MKAIVQRSYGGAETLELGEAPIPAPGTGEVLVRVRAAGIDRGTCHLMTGLPLVGRAAFGLRRPRAMNPGHALAGVVEAVGAGVSQFAVGDEVFGVGHSALAEYSVARQDRLAPKPSSLSFEEAATLPVSAQTALQAVRDVAHIAAGQSVLVIGASGGVGSYAVQLAHALGAEVTGVCGPTKTDLVRALGATRVIDYTREQITDSGRQYDVILDIGGNRPVSQLRRTLTPTGTLVIVGGEGGGRWLGGIQRQLGATMLSPWTSQRLTTFLASEGAATLEALAEFVERGELAPVLERTFALADTAKAVAHLEEGHVRGKVVVTP